MVSFSINNFLRKNLKIDDDEIVDYLIFLLEKRRMAEIEPYLNSDQFSELIDLWKKEKESNIYLEKIDLDFNTYDGMVEERFSQDFAALEIPKNEFKYKMNPNFQISNYTNELIDKIKNNKIVLIEGSTGCGKSTQISYFMLNFFEKIVVSQPRRIAASNLARRVAIESKTVLGDLIGYKIRFDEISSKNTRLKFVTDGMLLLEKNDFDLIIIDEVHERKISTDIFFALLTKFKFSRIILMSATLNSQKYIDFFHCAHLKIFQEQFPNKIKYVNSLNSNYCDVAVEIITDLLQNINQKVNILVFLTGLQEINSCYDKLLKKKLSSEIFKLHSSIQFKDQQKIFQPYNRSKVILSTNIAETSITIEDLDAVIDCGFVKINIWQTGIQELRTVRISKQQAKQRAGRVGRTKPGIVYRLYKKEEFDHFSNETEPEILNSNLANLIIQLKKFGVKNISKCDFLDFPPESNLKGCIERLFLLDILDHSGNLTKKGKSIGSLPLDPELALSLYSAQNIGVLQEMSALCALLSVPNILKLDDQDSLDRMKSKYMNCKNDFIFLLQIFYDYLKNKKYNQDLKKIINEKYVTETLRIQKQLLLIFKSELMPLQEIFEDKIRKITTALCTGFFLNTAELKDNQYSLFLNDEIIDIHPSSLCFKKRPKFILFFSIFTTSKQYVKTCMAITNNNLKKSSSYFKTRK